MSAESNAGAEQPAAPTGTGENSAAAPTGVACCEESDAKSMKPCALCRKTPVCKNCRIIVNGKLLCAECTATILTELEAEKATNAQLPLALAAGVAGAVVSGAIWAGVGIATGYAIGYVAVGVGYLTGHAVVLGAGKKKGRILQWAAIGCAFLGLVLGKYFGFAYINLPAISGWEGYQVNYYHPVVFEYFVANLSNVLRPMDALWVVIALAFAWGAPKSPEITVQ